MENETAYSSNQQHKILLFGGCVEPQIVAKTPIELHDGSAEGRIFSRAI